jgi:hypothetical protein
MQYYSKLFFKIVFLTIVIIVVVHAVNRQPPATNLVTQKTALAIQAIDTNGLLEAIKLPESLFIDTEPSKEHFVSKKIPRTVAFEEIDWNDLIKIGQVSAIVIVYGKRESLYKTMEIAERLSKDGGFPVYYYNEGIEGWTNIVNIIKNAYE